MAGTGEYMLRRDPEESRRLDAQHEFMRQLSHGHLVHPSIPCAKIRSVADVATGTGIWLRQLAASPNFQHPSDGGQNPFVGFDISPQQFPPAEELQPGISFMVHDMTKPFPSEYHEKFDLVNVRFISYVLKALELEKVVGNILQLLKPGGYLQWQECDACDSWSLPETPMATAVIDHIIAEKRARGLLPGVATPLLKTIMSYSVAIPNGHQNPISRSSDLMRLAHLEMISTLNHPSPIVQAGKKAGVISAATVLLESSISRKKAATLSFSASTVDAQMLCKEIKSMEELLEAVKSGEAVSKDWNLELMWLVARKAIVLKNDEAWMSIKYASS